jgi:hypothetical protein
MRINREDFTKCVGKKPEKRSATRLADMAQIGKAASGVSDLSWKGEEDAHIGMVEKE